MPHRIERTALFHKQFKKVKRNPRWKPVFQGQVPFLSQKISPWQFVISCFFQQAPLPDYFYVHQLSISHKLKQQLKRRLGTTMKIEVLELHFDGHNGDHLLVYHDSPEVTTLLAIGSHSSIFDQL